MVEQEEGRKKMSLALIGLILNFIGSFGLVLDTLINISKPKPHYSHQYWGERGVMTYKYERLKGGYLKRVKITCQEIRLIIFLTFISFGFLLQVLSYFII